MKKYLAILMVAVTLAGCDDEDLSPAERSVVSDESTTQFEELVLLINVTNENGYIVNEKIDSINLYVNGSFWASANSSAINTAQIETEEIDNFDITSQKLNYLIVAEQSNPDVSYTTAGEYASFLNSQLTLEPGEYVVLIESLQLTRSDGTKKLFYPYTYSTFTVRTDERSSVVQELSISL